MKSEAERRASREIGRPLSKGEVPQVDPTRFEAAKQSLEEAYMQSNLSTSWKRIGPFLMLLNGSGDAERSDSRAHSGDDSLWVDEVALLGYNLIFF
jgi:hypothetical protein